MLRLFDRASPEMNCSPFSLSAFKIEFFVDMIFSLNKKIVLFKIGLVNEFAAERASVKRQSRRAGHVPPCNNALREKSICGILIKAREFYNSVRLTEKEKKFMEQKIPGKSAATASMVLGIISVVLWFFGYSSIASVILGIIGLVLVSKAKGEGYESGIRTAGFVLSLIGVIGGVIVFIACIVLVSLFTLAI